MALWRDEPAWAPTFQELAHALGLQKQQEPALRSLLEELQSSGALRHQRRRFHLGRSAPAAPGEAAGARARPVSAARGEPEGLVGVFSAHPNGFGFADLTGERDSLFIPPPYVGGALDGDRVRIQRRAATGRDRTTARVVEVLERRHRRVRGHLQFDDGQCWVAPFNEKLPLIFISEGDERPPWPDGAIVEASITHFPEHHDEAPEGRIVQVFEGDADAPEQVVLHILSDLALAADFSPATLAEMQRLEPPRDAQRGRQDHRQLPYVTVDGADARDFDDAICLQTLRGGRRRLLVAIADVAAYVKPGSAVDGDAYRKGTSVYFPNQVFPMLPEQLSNDLCSLRPDEERLTLTCEMELDAQGRRLGHRVYESVIRSQARLTYAQVQHFFETGQADGSTPPIAPPIADMLAHMRALAAQLREMRDERGALDFTFPEYKFELDRKGFPRRVLETYPTEATRLIEQFMLEANETVARHCADAELPILYRVHDPPPPDQVNNLAVTLVNFGVELKTAELGRPGALKALLRRVHEHPQREQIELAILRSLSQAQYRSRNDAHFALAASHYTHFTSPIRRYPDLLVHRALKASLGGRRPPFTLAADAGLHTSLCERTAGEAEGRVVRLYKVLYLERRMGETFPATVRGVSERGLWVRLRDEPIDGLVPMAAIPIATPRYDRGRNRLITHGKQPNIGIGDQLRVTLARADRLTQQIEFAFLGWHWEPGHRADRQPPPPSAKGDGRPPAGGSVPAPGRHAAPASPAGHGKRAQAGKAAGTAHPGQPEPRGARGAKAPKGGPPSGGRKSAKGSSGTRRGGR